MSVFLAIINGPFDHKDYDTKPQDKIVKIYKDERSAYIGACEIRINYEAAQTTFYVQGRPYWYGDFDPTTVIRSCDEIQTALDEHIAILSQLKTLDLNMLKKKHMEFEEFQRRVDDDYIVIIELPLQ